MNQKKEHLLNEQNGTQSQKKLWPWIVLTLVCLIVLGASWASYLIRTHVEPAEVGDPAAQQAGLERGKAIADLYAKDAKAAPAQSPDKVNYGLEEGMGEEKPSGFILMSARKIRGEVDDHIRTYTLDVNAPDVFGTLMYDLGLVAMAEPKTNDTADELYVLARTQSQQESDGLSIFAYSSSSEELAPISALSGRGERNLEWSAAAKSLAFNRMKGSEGSYGSMLLVNNWEVQIWNPETGEIDHTIADAWKPQWSPDGKSLVYLKPDGLYAMTLESGVEKKLESIPEGTVVTTMAMLGISPDGTKLVWTTPKAGVIRIFALSNWADVSIEEVGRIETPETEYYWPVFSPEGDFYAVQAIDKLAGDDLFRKNARMEIRNINNAAPVVTSPIDGFDFDQLFTTAWVKSL
jgi:hypothetical protein